MKEYYSQSDLKCIKIYSSIYCMFKVKLTETFQINLNLVYKYFKCFIGETKINNQWIKNMREMRKIM